MIRVTTILLAALATVASAHAGQTSPRPNIVIILTDDQGWGDLTCYNPESKVITPNMDRLASQGVRMLNAYAPASVCSPTRYNLMTGRYSWRTWFKEGVLYSFDPSLIRPGRMTLGTMLQAKGYVTAAVGKWHMGLDWQTQEGDPGDWNCGQSMRYAPSELKAARVDFARPLRVGPNQLGFDEFFGTESQGLDKVVIRNSRRLPDVATRAEDHDDLFVEHAIEFVTEHHRRQPQTPFFLYLALGSPHHPQKCPARWSGKSGDGVRGDRILWADESVGRIMQMLDELRLADSTLLIFTSDNGASDNRRSRGGNPEHHPCGPYRGFKTDAWDGGFRVPMIVRWPGKVQPGTTAVPFVATTDLFATLAEITKTTLPRWAGEDSFSMLSAWTGGKTQSRDFLVLQSYTGILGIRDERWKLILGTAGSGGHQGHTPGWVPNATGWDRIGTITVGQLYDLQSDPYEQRNLFDEKADVVSRLRQKLEDIVYQDRSRPLD
jgi:arylsulfatase A